VYGYPEVGIYGYVEKAVYKYLESEREIFNAASNDIALGHYESHKHSGNWGLDRCWKNKNKC